MLQLQEQYITNAQGDRIAVILDITAYQKLLEEMDKFLCRYTADNDNSANDFTIGLVNTASIKLNIASRPFPKNYMPVDESPVVYQ